MFMENIAEVMHIIAVKSEAANPRVEGDYIGADGILYCGKCRTAKQCRPFHSAPDCAVYCLCKCGINAQRQAEAQQKRDEAERNRRECFQDEDGNIKEDRWNTFAHDWFSGTENSVLSRNYARMLCEVLDEEQKNRRELADRKAELKPRPECDWLLFSGTTGSGKSHYAACICNAVIDSGYTALFTSISEIERKLFGNQDKTEVYSALARYDLVVIDDFGAERESEYMNDIRYNVINYLMIMNIPCIITTNLSKKEMMSGNNANRRTYSRILKKAIPVAFVGEDLRQRKYEQEAADRRSKLLQGNPV